jgi:hypothetical protein
MNKKLGKFTVTQEFLHGCKNGEGVNLFDGFAPIDIRHDFFKETAEYIGYHEQFKLTPEGSEIPRYVAIFKDGDTSPTWTLSANNNL